MSKVFEKIRKDKYCIAFIAILVIAAVIRLVRLQITPGDGGINQDEAFAGWNAWSILHHGIDSSGYSYPVYLEAWGSGMNILETYLMIPFVALFGLTTFAIRLPQALLGIITIAVFYCFVKRVTGERRVALLAMLFLSISPWHIMMSRWGLESNLFPGMLLLGFYFLTRAEDNSKWELLAAFFWGLSLYCYAADWLIMPLLVGGSVIILIHNRVIRWDKWTSFSCLILFVMAAPLISFVLVNIGVLPEFKIGLISIAKINVFRSSDFSIALIPRQISTMMQMLISQKDDLISNSMPGYGMYYSVSNIFIVIAIGDIIYRIFHREDRRVLKPGEKIIVFWTLLALFLGCITSININRLNIIHLPMIFFWAYGCDLIVQILRDHLHFKAGRECIGLLYFVLFFGFISYYFTGYDEDTSKTFGSGLAEAIQIAENSGAEHIHVNDYSYSQVLFWSQIDGREFVDTVVYEDPDVYPLNPISFGKYINGEFTEDTFNTGDIYICRSEDDAGRQFMLDHGMTIQNFHTAIIGVSE